MRFDKLNEIIPYVVGPKKHVVSMHPYNAITLSMPGRHQNDTAVPGGDFVVMVDSYRMNWIQHQFTHGDLFQDIERKNASDPDTTSFLIGQYLNIICGDDPEKISVGEEFNYTNSLHPQTFFYAVQCLAVAEHRRYAHFEAKFGGRFLPFRFSAGIVEGLWTAAEAAEKQKWGRPAVERLERERGTPSLTKELFNA